MDFAATAVVAAGRLTLRWFRADVTVDNKLTDGFDPVTQADRAVERHIRDAVAARWPEHGVFGEEFGYRPGNGLTWVIDPIDGTRAFITGMVHWGVLLGLYDGRDAVVGAMYQPYTEELFVGDGTRAMLRRPGHEPRTLAVSGVETLADAVLACTGPQWFDTDQLRAFERLSAGCRMLRYGGDCYLYAMLAMGFVDVACEAGLAAYDILPLIPLIHGAGGVVTSWDGGDVTLGGDVLACANERLHAQALALLARG